LPTNFVPISCFCVVSFHSFPALSQAELTPGIDPPEVRMQMKIVFLDWVSYGRAEVSAAKHRITAT